MSGLVVFAENALFLSTILSFFSSTILLPCILVKIFRYKKKQEDVILNILGIWIGTFCVAFIIKSHQTEQSAWEIIIDSTKYDLLDFSTSLLLPYGLGLGGIYILIYLISSIFLPNSQEVISEKE